MTTTLVMALYTEGATDERFLELIAQRTAESLLLEFGSTTAEIFPIQRMRPQQNGNHAQSILEVARMAHGYHLLLLHADADNDTPTRALEERILPGIDLVRQAADKNERICERCVPIIPVYMTEAWLLVDGEAFCNAVGTSRKDDELGLPSRVTAAERVADPKARVEQAFQNALAGYPQRRRRHRHIGELYEPLGRTIRLERLEQLNAYQQFRNDLADALVDLNILRRNA